MENITNQAKKMLKRAQNKCPPVAVGDTVQLSIPDVDQGPLDPPVAYFGI